MEEIRFQVQEKSLILMVFRFGLSFKMFVIGARLEFAGG